MFILDTDHVSLFQRNHPEVTARILSTPPFELATTIITTEEQLRGRLTGYVKLMMIQVSLELITI